MADLTRRLYAAAEIGTTPEEITRAVCREAAAWLTEEAAMFAARTAPADGSGLKGGDCAHHSAIVQIADHLARVGDARIPA